MKGAFVPESGGDEPVPDVLALLGRVASHEIGPIVAGTKRKRYENRRFERSASSAARAVSTTSPERLSFASWGWQTCVEKRISSRESPGRYASPQFSSPVDVCGVDLDLVLALRE